MTAEELDDLLRQRITDQARAYLRKRGQLAALANRAQVGSSTLSRLIYGDTRRPHLATVLRVAVALGIRIRVTVEEGGEKKSYHKTIPKEVFERVRQAH